MYQSYEYSRHRQKRQEYILQKMPVFSKDALFSDSTENYRIPMEPEPGERITIRFRTLKNNVDEVYLVVQGFRIPMYVGERAEAFDYYETELALGKEMVEYYFEIVAGQIRCYYYRDGVFPEQRDEHFFRIVPGFKTPQWAKGAVIYQIYVDRFYNGDATNDVLTGEYFYIGDASVQVEDWNKPPAVMGVREFYGGDLKGVMDKLDYLQDLGVEALYLNPIFVSPSNHKYDIQDYDYVDPHLGRIVKDEGELLQPGSTDNKNATRYICRVTDKENLEASNRFFIQLVEEIHKRGMRIILDGVFNHCGSFNKWMDRECIYEDQEAYEKGAYVSEGSPYRDFFHFHDAYQWPYNDSYEGWWGHDTLPKLNYEKSPQLYQYILDVARKWVSPPFNVDGWRLDVAADLGHSNSFNHQFWKDFRKAVKEANPEALILAEHYGNAESWLQGDEWDSIMNYDAFMEPVTWFLTGMEKHSDEFREDLYGNGAFFFDAMTHHMSSFLTPSQMTAMNELSNHDHSRFLTRTNHKVGRLAHLGSQAAQEGICVPVMREAVVIQMTWPGAPTIYYGDEAGVCGFTDPDSRRTYPWGREDRELIQFHKDMIAIHKQYAVFVSGSIKFLVRQYQGISYGRFSRTERAVVAVNNSQEIMHMEIPVWQVGVSRFRDVPMERVFITYSEGYSMERVQVVAKGGYLDLELPPLSAIVLYHGDV
ncbi:MAG: glycoside hydrolase family 13 protein [Lachnospiraceae bacterium]|nr:glycoside hydrolase family 13 protein [Lachnospiraceae bacterium]